MRRILALVFVLIGASTAHAAEPFPGTTWSEHYFPSDDGTMLHADVLRPSHLPADAKTPVILTVSPYTNHAGATTWSGQSGPSNRFYDFLELGQIPQRGYTYVMVDLRGFGGSAGCNDWGGPGERMDSKAAVEWAATQPWSTGKVGMVGKSYDGWTGLMAIAERPKGLEAVLSMEPVYSGYRYLYMDGVRFSNSLSTPIGFTQTDAMPGSPGDTAEYHLNGNGPNAPCYAANISSQQQDDQTIGFWKARDLLPPLEGATTPLFLTQGFLESNTKPDGAFDVFRDMAGPKRAWFGQFDHVRGWEVIDDELATGKAGFIDEAMRFLDHYLKGAPAPQDPPVVVQAIDGRYRGEQAWPPADAAMHALTLRAGSYSDATNNDGEGEGGGNGLWTISPPLPHDAHLAGVPAVELEVEGAERANLVVNVYDIAPDGRATMISRGAKLLREASGTVTVEMYGQDWPLAAGHRIGVLVSGANNDWWSHTPTGAEVTIARGTVRLPFLRYRRDSFLDGAAGARLRGFLESAPFPVDAQTVSESLGTLEMPPPLTAAPTVGPAPATPTPTRLTLRARLKGTRLRISGAAASGTKVRLAVRRGRRVLARRAVTATADRFRVRVKVPRRGRLKVTAIAGDQRARAIVRR